MVLLEWSVICILICMFAVICYSLVLRIRLTQGVRLNVALAGDVRYGGPCSRDIVNLNKDGFINATGERLEIKESTCFSVYGTSMLLCGIQDGDILFTQILKKDEDLHCPTVIVLKRDHMVYDDISLGNVAQYKVRRAWAEVLMQNVKTLEQQFDSIVQSDEFKQLINEKNYQIFFPSIEEMKKDFFEVRLKKYKEDYPTYENIGDDNHKAIISTTLDKRTNLVHFSIHPRRCLVGEVTDSFGIKEAA